MQHTKGPWTLNYGGGYGKGHLYAEDSNFEGQSLAAAHFPPLYNKGGLSREAFEIMEANAHLIAAAPELLEACRLLLAESEQGEYADNRPIAKAQSAAQKAIAKALGFTTGN